MDILCPVCNGLRDLNITCPKCGKVMIDNGKLDNYWGPYSPYEDQKILELNNGLVCKGPDPCIHLLTCKNCNLNKKYIIDSTVI